MNRKTHLNMQENARVALNLRKLGLQDKVDRAKSLLTALTGNKDFPNPIPPLASLKEAIASLEAVRAATVLAIDRAKTAKAVQRQQEVALDKLIRSLASYVQAESSGNEVKIKSTGLRVRSNRAVIGLPDAPDNLKAMEGGNEGTIELKWKSVQGKKSYLVRMTETIEDAGSWKHLSSTTKSVMLVDGLASGKKYWFQVAAISTAGQGAWSSPVPKVAP
jgi:Fibronectin type III domain